MVLAVERRGKPLTFRIRRERFEVRSVEGRLLEDGYGYVKIRIFSSNTDSKLLEALEDMKTQERGQGRAARADPGPAPQSGRAAGPGGAGGRPLHRRGADRAHRGQGGAGDGPADGPQPGQLDRASRWWCWSTARPRRPRRSSPGALQDHQRAVIMGGADLRQGLGADGDGDRRLRRQAVRAEADGVALLHAQRALDPEPGHHARRVRRCQRPARGRAGRRRGCGRRTTTVTCATTRATWRPPRKRMSDHQLQVALEYLRSWAVFQKQASKKG